MKFYVIWSDGRKFGPADIPTLNQWIAEGRVDRDTTVENADTGQRGYARDVLGLVFHQPTQDLGGHDPMIKTPDAGQQSRPVDIPGQPRPYIAGQPEQQGRPVQQPVQQQNPYANPPQPGSPYPRSYNPHADDGSAKMITNAWILYVVGFLCCCVCTPFGLYSANRAKNMGNPDANAPVIVGWILLALQIVGYGIYGLMIGAGGFGGFP